MEDTIHPNAPEICNRVDDDCDGVIDNDCVPGTDAGPADAGVPDTGPSDAAVEVMDGGETDTGLPDAGASDAQMSDTEMSDAAMTDSGTPDSGMPDSGMDSGMPDSGMPDAGMPLPATCTTSAECGPRASCDTTISHCVCNAGSAACGTTCCSVSLEREVVLPITGHAPELGFDAAGNVYVLFLVGTSSVRLAQIAPDDTVTVVTVGTSSGEGDAHDLVVAPDGTVYVAIHVDLGSRSGDLILHTRAPGASTFTSMGLTIAGRPGFAYDAAIGLSRASNGDLYGSLTQRSGDGTRGMYVARFDAALGAWSALPTILSYHGFYASELFARDDGFFIGATDLGYSTNYWTFDAAGGSSAIIATTSGMVTTLGESAAAMNDVGELYTFTSGLLSRSGTGSLETVRFPAGLTGRRSDIDMAVDRYGNPVLAVHDSTSHNIGLAVRMPTGGVSRAAMSPESIFLPFPMTSLRMTLDLEINPAGDLALAVGDSMDRGTLVYREYAY